MSEGGWDADGQQLRGSISALARACRSSRETSHERAASVHLREGEEGRWGEGRGGEIDVSMREGRGGRGGGGLPSRELTPYPI